MNVNIKSTDEIVKMRAAGQAAMKVLKMIEPSVRVGITTDELNTICHDYIVNELSAIPAPLNYQGFPKSICTSVNHVICHGIPSEKKLKKSDIINIDVTVIKDGYHGDCSRMFSVGKVGVLEQRLMRVSHECMVKGIEMVKPGVALGDIGHVIQAHAEKKRFLYCARVLRSWHWQGLSRKSPGVALRHPRNWRHCGGGNDIYYRAYGQCRT